jgi:hypothetical protein
VSAKLRNTHVLCYMICSIEALSIDEFVDHLLGQDLQISLSWNLADIIELMNMVILLEAGFKLRTVDSVDVLSGKGSQGLNSLYCWIERRHVL